MTIMSKDSQQVPERKPDPLAQYPERYSQSADDDDQTRDQLLKLGVHEDYIDEMTPEQRRARLAGGRVESDSGLEKPIRTRGLKPKPEQYDEASQTEPTPNAPIEQRTNIPLPPRKKKPFERDDTRDFLKDMRAWDRKNARLPSDPPPKRL
jgi:hypothetical protein